MAWKPTLHFECPPPPPPPPVRGTRRGRKVVTPPVIQVKVLNHQENGPSNGSNTVNWVSPQFEGVDDKFVKQKKTRARPTLPPRTLFKQPTNSEDSCRGNSKQCAVLEFVTVPRQLPEATPTSDPPIDENVDVINTPSTKDETIFNPLTTSTPSNDGNSLLCNSTILAEDTPTYLYEVHPYH